MPLNKIDKEMIEGLGEPNGIATLNADGKVVDSNGNLVEGKVTSVNGQIGDVVIPDSSTAVKGIVQLNDTLTSTSTTEALTANQGKVLDDKITVLTQDLGDKNALNTTDKTDLVAGINEVNVNLMEITQVSVTYNGVTRFFKNESTTLYVGTDSVIGNDGLSVDKPIKLKDVEIILNELKKTFPKLLGIWKIKLSAGLYQGDGLDHMFEISDIESENYIEIEGEYVPKSSVPTTILDGKTNGSLYYHGFYFRNIDVKVSNIKFQNFTESLTGDVVGGSRSGIIFSSEEGKGWFINIHSVECSWAGIGNQGAPKILVEGGNFERCRYGVMSMNNTTVTIGYGGSDTTPETENTRLIGCYEAGLYLASGSSGHINYCIIENNKSAGLYITSSSTIHAMKNKFRTNYFDIRVHGQSRVLDNANTYEGSTQIYDVLYSSVIEFNDGRDFLSKRRDVSQNVEQTNDYFVKNLPTGNGTILTHKIPSNVLQGKGKTVELIMFGKVANINTNTCRIIVEGTDGINTVELIGFDIPSTVDYENFKLEFFLTNWNKTTFNTNGALHSQLTGSIINYVSGATLDSTKEITLNIKLVVNGLVSDTYGYSYRIIPRLSY